MNIDTPDTSAGAARGWAIHPMHRPAMRRIGLLLLVLALVQALAWGLTGRSPHGIEHYLPLHALMEIAAIVIAMMVFAVGWNAHGGRGSGNLVVLACAFFAVALLDFSHTMSYSGMPDYFTPNDREKHLNFWLAARLLASVAMLVVMIRGWRPTMDRARRHALLAVLFALTLLFHWLVLSHQHALPHLFVEGRGLTPLKKDLEYLCVLINLATLGLLWLRMREPLRFNAPLLFGAVGVMAMSEIYFTLYTTMTGPYNVLGHVYKVISYLLIYRAVVVESIERPYTELQNTRRNLELAVSASNTGLWAWDAVSGRANLSTAWKAQLGYADDEIGSTIDAWESLLHPDEREAAARRVREFIASDTETVYEDEYRLRHKDGSYHWILSRGEKQRDARGRTVRMIGANTDLTERRRAEDRFRTAVEASPTGMIMVDEHGVIVLTNARTDKVFGYPPGALVGKPIDILVPDAVRAGHHRLMEAYLPAPAERPMGEGRELFARHADGHEFRVEIGLTPIAGQDARYVIASVVDITTKIESEQRIDQLINYDPLTGLPNRNLLNDRVTHAIHSAQRERQHLAVLFMDLDHFKHVNDTLGHGIGDQLLVEVGKRLRDTVRESDTVSRIGGDEFVIVLGESEAESAARVAAKLLEAVARPYHIATHELVVTPSIGIAMYPDDGTGFETLYKHADTAMYRAKQDGRNDYRFFTQEMQSRTERILVLESAMRQALDRGQFQLVYQPQFAMDGRTQVGLEALLRWTHPELGPISPGEFVPLAESNGLIIPIGAWVIRTAVRQLRVWMDEGLAPGVMAVNLSAVQFRHPNLPELVTRTLDEAQVAPEYLELELTEGVAMDSPQNAVAVMDRLHARGVRLSIDDFGTGYSSLSYLKRFSVYKVKIDQSFVRDIATDADDRAIVSAIVQMAHSLGFRTIAEGVETPAQRDYLQQQGCDEVQGYLFARPMPAEQAAGFMRSFAARSPEADGNS